MDARQRVLVVDDDQDIRELVVECLHGQCSVTLLADAPTALETITRAPKRFDALVVDLEMPQMDGATLIEELRHRDIHLPALIISGTPDAPNRAQRAQADFLTKPFDVSCLQDKVDRLLHDAPRVH
jgi:DNA-binding NtrC family response regulator